MWIHGHAIYGKVSRTYRSWQAMKERCYKPKSINYGRYGGKGITVCERWRNSFVNFLADMGERPEGTTMDRKNSKGNYEPGNCRWATDDIQQQNRIDIGRPKGSKRVSNFNPFLDIDPHRLSPRWVAIHKELQPLSEKRVEAT